MLSVVTPRGQQIVGGRLIENRQHFRKMTVQKKMETLKDAAKDKGRVIIRGIQLTQNNKVHSFSISHSQSNLKVANVAFIMHSSIRSFGDSCPTFSFNLHC